MFFQTVFIDNRAGSVFLEAIQPVHYSIPETIVSDDALFT